MSGLRCAVMGALALLAAPACDAPQPVLELGGGGDCNEVVLGVREQLLPYWDVGALVMERVDGDSGWAIGRDPGLRVMLQALPDGPGFDLSKLGPLHAFRLLPGLHPEQSWMTLDRGDKLRVWRLGSAAAGEGVEAPDLAAFPGPGEWRRRLMIVDGVPYLLAAPPIELAEHITLYVAALDPETLALGTIWPVDFTRPCMKLYGPDPDWCASEQGAWVDILDVAEAGSVAGGVALLGIRQSGLDAQYAVLQLRHQDGPAGPIAARRDGFFVGNSAGPGSLGVGLAGQLAADANNLYFFIEAAASPDWLRLYYMPLRADSPYGFEVAETAYPAWTGPLVQLGSRAVLGDFARGQWTLAPVRGGAVELDVRAGITVEADAKISSAGREQLLVMPPSGHALRVVAGCAADP